MATFSERHGFTPPDAEIVTREAPPELRSGVVALAYESGMTPNSLRRVLCKTLFVEPDSNNWSEFPNVDGEVRGYFQDIAWYEVYDLIEAIALDLPQSLTRIRRPGSTDVESIGCPYFEQRLNALFRKKGIGWQIINRKIEYRGTEAFEKALHGVQEFVRASGRPTAATELHEAIKDLSRRPEPETTGAIQHAMAALECVARDHASSRDTLGDVIKKHRALFPAPLDVLIEKAWGYTSNFGRHLVEGKAPNFEEAELIVGLSAIVSRYLTRKRVQ